MAYKTVLYFAVSWLPSLGSPFRVKGGYDIPHNTGLSSANTLCFSSRGNRVTIMVAHRGSSSPTLEKLRPVRTLTKMTEVTAAKVRFSSVDPRSMPRISRQEDDKEADFRSFLSFCRTFSLSGGKVVWFGILKA